MTSRQRRRSSAWRPQCCADAVSRATCRVRALRLRAPTDALVRRGAILLEDALRTASLPGNARLLVVRRLDLGSFDGRRAASGVALLVEDRLRRIDTGAVHYASTGADRADVVFFDDDVEPLVALALRVAAGEPAPEWFWRLAVPVETRTGTRGDVLRLLLAHALAKSSARTPAALRLVGALLERNLANPLLEALRESDGPALWHAFDWGDPAPERVAPNDEMPSALSASHAATLSRWVMGWGPSDLRSRWLAAMLLAVERPTRLLDTALPDLAASTARLAGRSAASCPSLHARTDAPGREPARSALATADVTVPSSTGSVPRVDASHGLATWPAVARHSEHAGVWLLVPLLTMLGVEPVLRANTGLIERDWALRLLRLLVRRLGATPDDAATVALDHVPALATPDDRALTAGWLRRMRAWCVHHADLPLRRIVCRHGRVTTTPTHVDVIFDHRQADVRIRTAGLDLDPGWVPWLGRVVHFHYLYGEASHAE